MKTRKTKQHKIFARKFVIVLVIMLSNIAIHGQEHKLVKIWETDTTLAVPESVLPDKTNNRLFVSLIDGGGWNADGKGAVAILSPTGKQIDSTWITGLHAPKGMGLAGSRLYVADISEVLVIDIAKKKIENRIDIDSAK